MKDSPRIGVVVFGVLVGAFLGGAFAWLASNRDTSDGDPAIANLGPSDYFQLGIGVLTLARQFGALIQKT
ncbi:hypothetical protein GC175_09995 [bacterium]|nr:hypothetical protein [bacterium]